jgi:hypothetical protein
MKFFTLNEINPRFISLVFVFKVAAGCLLGLIYTYYYTDRSTADTFKFFDDGNILFGALSKNPKHFFEMLTGINSDSPELTPYYERMNAWYNIDVLFNDNHTLVRLNTLFRFFSFGNYYVHVVFINFISFCGLISLFRLFQSFQKNKSKELFAGIMLLPSMLFWGSGLLKDGLLIFALGMLLYSLNKIIFSRHTVTNIIAFVSCLLLLTITKLYVLIIIFPGIIAWYWARDNRGRTILFKFLFCYSIYFALAFNIGEFNNKYKVQDLIYYKQKNFYVLAENTKAKSVIAIDQVEPTAWSIIGHSPKAMLRVLLRPFVTDSRSPLILMAAIENILVLLIIVACILSYKRGIFLNQPVFYFAIFFVILMYSLIGLITPILGAMVRYKVPALPFLMYIFISMYDREIFKRRFLFWRKKAVN